MLSLPCRNIRATSVFPITLALCSPTVSICIFLAKGFLTFLTLATVALASAGVANFIDTVSLGFSSVYNLLPLPFGFLPVPFLGSLFDTLFSPSAMRSFAKASRFFTVYRPLSFSTPLFLLWRLRYLLRHTSS